MNLVDTEQPKSLETDRHKDSKQFQYLSRGLDKSSRLQLCLRSNVRFFDRNWKRADARNRFHRTSQLSHAVLRSALPPRVVALQGVPPADCSEYLHQTEKSEI
jgi:hypothetical protein